jgi:hypothetical protein
MDHPHPPHTEKQLPRSGFLDYPVSVTALPLLLLFS